MKNLLKKSFLMLIIFSLISTSFVFATESITSQNSEEITEVVGKEENSINNKEEAIIPSEKYFENSDENKKNEGIQSKDVNNEENVKSGIATIATNVNNFQYTTKSDGTLSITGYTGKDEVISIPSKINNKTVNEIASYAFYDNKYIREVTIPSTVKTIGMGAFAYTIYLKKVNLNSGLVTIENNAFRESRIYSISIPNTVKTIKDYAFFYCDLGGDLTIPDSVEKIGSQAFARNNNITSLNLGKNLSSIGIYAFAENPTIESISINSNNKYFKVENGVLFNNGKTELILYPSKKSNTSYSIPNTVKKIKTASFYGNKIIKTLTIPNSVTEIETGAFVDCTSLSKITLGTGLKTIKDYAFNNVAITDISIPASVTSLNSIAFMGTKTLKNINVDSKNTVYISVNGVVFSKDKKKLLIYPRGKTEKTYTIPSSVNTIGESAFIDAAITSITIPSSVTTLEDWCFGRAALTSITLPSTIKTMENGPFDSCANLKSVVINCKVDLPYRMFAECTNLSSVKLNDNIEVIGSRAFYKCTKLTSITLPKNLKRMEYSFVGCTGLSKVTIPSKVEWISESTFEKNTKIDISQTKLKKLDNGTYAITYKTYLTGTFYYDKAYEVLDLVNKERAKQNLSQLKMDSSLLETAMERAKEIAIYFEHTRPSGLSCFSANSKMDAENIAAGSSTASGTMNQWMNSSGHKANILTAGRKSIGIGCYCINGIYFWVQCFSSSNATVGNKPANKTQKQKVETLEDKIELKYNDNKNISIGIGKTSKVKTIYNINQDWRVSVPLEPESFNWSSSNNSIAKVNNQGVITGVKTGKATVTASIGSKKITFNVNITLDTSKINASMQSNYMKNNKSSMCVILPQKGKKDLTKTDLDKLIEQKGLKGKVKQVTFNGKNITNSQEYIGTGTKIKQDSGKESTLILYGDVNQDGEVNILDALMIAYYDNGIESGINSEETKLAADVVDTGNSEINILDALRIAYFDNELLGTDDSIGDLITDESLFPADN